MVDNVGTEVHDALPVGKGGIDWAAVKPTILKHDFILEIDLDVYEDCSPIFKAPGT